MAQIQTVKLTEHFVIIMKTHPLTDEQALKLDKMLDDLSRQHEWQEIIDKISLNKHLEGIL